MVRFSVLIITHGREELLLKCLDSLRPPVQGWQLILVANGQPISEEVLTRARSLTEQVDILELEQKENPGRSRNLGLQLAKHEWVFFIDDDAYVLPGYWEKALALLDQSRLDVLGGPDAPAPQMQNFSTALAIALSSPFCTGLTSRRHASRGKELVQVDEEGLTSCNLWVRTEWLRKCPFPENYLRTEETALLLDMKQLGARMFHHPRLVVAHHRRKDLRSLWHPTFYAGFFRSRVMREKNRGAGIFWLPALFVLLHLTLFFSPATFLLLARIYAGIILLMSLNLASRYRRIGLFMQIALLHYVIVFMYGLGFLAQRVGYRGHR